MAGSMMDNISMKTKLSPMMTINWSIHDYWYDLIHKCLDDTILHSWDELINDLADVIDIFIRTNGDQWIKFIAEYNLIFLKLLKRNSQFYP
ncbi:Tethering factor [Dirofilaria immitis]